MKETFIKRYIVERTNKAEIRPEGQSEKAESCRENLWNENLWQARLVYVRHKPQNPHHVKVSPWGHKIVTLCVCVDKNKMSLTT